MPDAAPGEGRAACPSCAAKIPSLEFLRVVASALPPPHTAQARGETVERRLAACACCEALREQVLCAHCGCFVQFRSRIYGASCPHPAGNRWERAVELAGIIED
jgi:hypothetical protein